MATPYSEDVIARAKRYYETKYGITVVATESLGATNSYAIGKMDADSFKRTAEIALKFGVIKKAADEKAYTTEIYEMATKK